MQIRKKTFFRGENPFIEEIMRASVARNFKSLDMDLYDGKTDPRHHLSNFKSWMYLVDASDATRCKAFPTMLTKVAIKWFDSLLPRSITCFDDLARKFLTRFSVQKESQIRSKPPRSQARVIIGLVNGLKEGPFSQSIPKRHPTSPEIYHIEKLPRHCLIKNKKDGSRAEYYEYHKIYGHSTNDCYDLKNVIEKLAREGRLERYLAERSDDQGKRKRVKGDRSRRDWLPRTTDRHIHMIVGGFARVGITKSSRKRHLKDVYQVREEAEVPDLPTISFMKEDVQGITSGHDDPVVITIIL
ncbi:uncharacterized protein DS421_15g505670 [Arachis hypogaea]|nr:uncharacterized protein DS421_15g505670 [Arachis hypogaea]